MNLLVLVGVAAAVALAVVGGQQALEGTALASPAPELPRVLYRSGDVIHEGQSIAPTYVGVTFTVPSIGARLVGEIRWDHDSPGFGVFSAHQLTVCGAEFAFPSVPPDYQGGPWSQTFDRHLGPGQYWFGIPCWGAWANATVVWSVMLIFPP